jgi:predicted ATPase/class 3 adenylate cyclase
LPSGTVTFVFTDIEGSTQRWERGRTAMETALRRHDEVVRAAFARYGGHVFKTIGDAFCAAFARPEDGVAAVLDAQRSLAAEDFSAVDGLPIRAAVHTGTADERNGDYFGPAVNRVARLLAIGHGGQVLVSGVTADLVQGDLPAQTSLRDLGEHRLRDLARPEYVYQLVAPDLPADFPPLRSLDTLPNNLPLQLKSFVGREAEIAEITSLLEKHRLVTLVGSGGVGKTRTSLQVAANLLDGSGDGVWFVELAPLASGDFIPSAVAQALGFTLPIEGDPLANLTRALKPKHLLLVFDNCEHMVEPAARVISAILRDCPRVKVLASSRQGLGIEGEATFRMPSLDVPAGAEGAPVAAADSTRFAAVALFAERARAVDNRFEVTDDNAPIIADICRRLDGIPLAIELAASRVKMLTPQQVRDRLDERFRMLTGGSRDVLPRQQTLRALIDWSHDLLDERERVLFRRLGIFVNGFTLEGAVAVGSGEDLDEFELFDVLSSLVDKSLVLAEPQGDTVRYRMLESTRAYAAEKLRDAGEHDLLAARHLEYFRSLFADLQARIERTGRSDGIVEALLAELEDVRVALDESLTRADVLGGAALLALVGRRFDPIGLTSEGIRRIERFLAVLPEGHALLSAQLLSALSILFDTMASKVRAFETAVLAVADARAASDPETLAFALLLYAQNGARAGQHDAAGAALAEADALPDATALRRSNLLDASGSHAGNLGDLETAARLREQLRQQQRALGNTRGEAVAVFNLAEVEHARRNTQRAVALVNEILPGVRRGPDKLLLANALANLAGYLVAVDDPQAAVRAAREAIEIVAPTEPDHTYVPIAVEHIALARALLGEVQRAATLEGYCATAFERVRFERERTEHATHARLSELLASALTPEELAELTAEGAALSPEQAIALALEDP